MASVIALIALDAEIRRHWVEALIGSHELTLSGVDSDNVTNRQAAFTDQVLT